MTHDDLAFSDATEIGRLIAAKTVSSLEVTRLYLERLHAYGERYGAVVTIMDARALREAKRADREIAAGQRRGPLHGVPYGVKDLLAATGAPTTWGAQPFRDQRFDYDATVVRKLGEAGAVLLAKLAMVELAGGFGYDEADASFTGPGRTPWNRNFWSGGSSSGSAAATSAGLVGFSIGSETSGSILTPSTFCGVTGLRPTYGRVSRHGAMALCWTLDKLGPIARSARDGELVLRTIAGHDPADATSVDRPFHDVKERPRLAIPKRATERIMPEVRENFNRAVDVLRGFCDIVTDVPIPDFPYGPAVGTIVNAEGAAAFQDLIESGRSRELRAKADRTGGYAAYATPAIDYINALRMRVRMVEAFERAYAPYDAIVMPTLAVVAYPLDVPFAKAYPANVRGRASLIGAGNLVGWPALGMPSGFGPNGLPTGISLLGKPFAENVIASIAARFQQHTDFHRKRPLVA